MPLELHPIVASDMADCIRIQHAAFDTGMASELNPKPVTPERFQKQLDKAIKGLETEPDVQWLKVIDTDLDGKIIACAKWRVNHKPRTEEQVEASLPKPGKHEEGNQAAIDLMNYLSESRRRFMGGKPFYLLHVLVTHPDHHRRGAGGMLVRWGTEGADRDQLPAYLESSEAGNPLYKRHGFQNVRETVFDLAKYGKEGKEINWNMLRDPVK